MALRLVPRHGQGSSSPGFAISLHCAAVVGASRMPLVRQTTTDVRSEISNAIFRAMRTFGTLRDGSLQSTHVEEPCDFLRTSKGRLTCRVRVGRSVVCTDRTQGSDRCVDRNTRSFGEVLPRNCTGW